MKKIGLLVAFAAMVSGGPALAQDSVLPAATDPNFCQVVQQIMANTQMESENTVFTDMPEYRHSKPAVEPSEATTR